MKNIDRRQFMQLMGTTAVTGALGTHISKALAIPAHNRTGTIMDVDHVIILTQENQSFDRYFGTLRGVRGFSDPHPARINLPLTSGTGTTPVPVYLQPAPAGSPFAVRPDSGNLGGPSDGVNVLPPFRIKPEAVSSGLTSLGLTYMPGTSHGWGNGHAAWNLGQYDGWASAKGPFTMTYLTRDDIPYHYALADAFTVCDAYHCSIMGPTNPNRCYIWSGCIGNVDYLGAGGTDGLGAGPVTSNGLSPNNAYYIWTTYPERLQAAGVTWKIYQDLAGATFAPDFGDGTGNSFIGNFTDNPVLYFNQYANAAPGTPLFDNAATGTQLSKTIPPTGAPASAWTAWADHLFSDFRRDVTKGTLPQVSYLVAPAGYTEHSDWPSNYGAWYIAKILEILVSNPEVWSRTVFLINYDENDGDFDHIVPPTPAQTSAGGGSTVSIKNEIVTTSVPAGPIGLGVRVPFLAISPWSKGGYVNSQVFDHTSVIRFLEQRFGVMEPNISPWRRAVAGDLTSVFNFARPNTTSARLPQTAGYLPPASELAGTDGTTFVPTAGDVTFGVPTQEKGIRPARALPYEFNVHGSLQSAGSAFGMEFFNTGGAAVVFQVRSANPADAVRTYTVEPGKKLTGTWIIAKSYDLTVLGPNGFVRTFKGTVGGSSLRVRSRYRSDDGGTLGWQVANVGGKRATVSVRDAYTGRHVTQHVNQGEEFEGQWSAADFHGWYNLVVTVIEDDTCECRLAGHIETGRDSYSDPAMGGIVKLKA